MRGTVSKGAAAAVLIAGLLFERGVPSAAQGRGGTAAGQGRGGAAAAGTQGGSTYRAPRTWDGKPDIGGIWQAVNAAWVDLEAHNAAEGEPAGLSVVEGGEIPYKPEALAKRKENFAKRKTEDPINKCFLAGVPRIIAMPFPFQIVQTPKFIGFASEYDHATRTIYTDGTKHPGIGELWMGDSRARWEGETLVVDVAEFHPDTWFDRAGNYHSDALHVVERFTRTSADILSYEATIEDPKVFTRPWKINMPLYRRQEKNLQLLDYTCLEFREPFLDVDELVKTKK
jgi:hypothetical protein